MDFSGKPVTLSFHAKEQARFRGCAEEEIVESIQRSLWKPAELGRRECRLDIPFDNTWNGTWYRTKQVRPIFTEEKDRIVVVTVYVYYF